MSTIRALLIFVGFLTALSGAAIAGGDAASAERKMGDTEWYLSITPSGNFYRLITHGSAVWGHEIGVLIPTENCDVRIIWISW